MRPIAVAVSVVLAGAFAAPTLAQGEPAPLAGPPVEQVRPDRLEQGLTTGAMPGMQMGQIRQLPMRDVRELLEAMSSEGTDEEIRISAEQDTAIRELTREHQGAVRAYRAEHAERIESLRIRGGLQPVRIPDDQLSDAQRGARYELQQLVRMGPTDADLQARVFAVLAEPQRAHLNAAIDRLIEQRSRERRERLYAEELNAEPIDPKTFFNDDGSVNMDALPAPLRARLAQVPEEQQAQRLRRILERLSQRQAASRAGTVEATDKRPPPRRIIEVPEPE